MGSAGINAKRRCFGHLPKESEVCSRSFPGRCASFPTRGRWKSAGESEHSNRIPQLKAKQQSGTNLPQRTRWACASDERCFGYLRGQSSDFGDAKHQVQTLNGHAGRPLAEVVEPCREQHVAGYVGKNTK